MDKQWIVERSALIQRIELLESTIGEMKERELKIKRINDTLLHSLSANGESASGSSGLRKVMLQQEKELQRLHDRLKQSGGQSRKAPVIDKHFSSQQDKGRLQHPNKQRSLAVEADSAQLEDRIRLPRQHSVRLRVNDLQQSPPNKPSPQPEQSVSTEMLARDRFKLKSKSVRFHEPYVPEAVSKPQARLASSKKRADLSGGYQFPKEDKMNISGYVNFLRGNPTSLNYQLIQLHPPGTLSRQARP